MCLNLPASSWGSAYAAAGWLLLLYLHCCWDRNVQAEVHDATRALGTGTLVLGSLLRGVPLPAGRRHLAVCRQTSGKRTGNLGSAWGSLLCQKDICLILSFYRFMAGWWGILEEYWRLLAHDCEDQAGWDSRQQQQNPSWAQKSTLPPPPLALPGPQPWGNLWGTTGVPVAPQGWSQCKMGETGAQEKEKEVQKASRRDRKAKKGSIWWHQGRLWDCVH